MTDGWNRFEDFDPDTSAGRRIICAFCFKTSAGVRIKHDTSSAVAEAALWMKGWGISGNPL